SHHRNGAVNGPGQSERTLATASLRVASLLSSADSVSIGSCLFRQDRDREPSDMRARGSSGMFGAKLRWLAPVGLVGAAAVASVLVLANLGISPAAARSGGIRGGAHGILFSFAQPSNPNNAYYGGDLYRWTPGGQPVRLTSDGLRNWARWSPDGKLIAF